MADHEDYETGAAPAAHKVSHQDGGADEISVAGLAGETLTLAAHKILPAIHHVKFTAAEARAAINDIFGADGKADADINLDTHKLINVVDPVTDQGGDTRKARNQAITDHAAVATAHQDAPNLILTHKGDASAHHAKFTAAEARDAVRAILGDNVEGRTLRISWIKVDNGTNADTVKVYMASYWNGNAIAWTDNIAKGATTGHYSLSADGTLLTIEASGLTGNCKAVPGASTMRNSTGKLLAIDFSGLANDISLSFQEDAVGGGLDITVLVDTGAFYLTITYITDA